MSIRAIVVFLVKEYNPRKLKRHAFGEDYYRRNTDTDIQKREEQTGLGTLVVHAVTDEYLYGGKLPY